MSSLVSIVVIAVIAALLAAGLIAQIWRWKDGCSDKKTWQGLARQSQYPVKTFHLSMLEDLPEAAQRYFRFTIEPATPLYTVSIVNMTGRIGLGDKHNPKYQAIQARQILSPPYGFVWRFQTRGAMSVSGSDGLQDENSWVRLWLFATIPVVRQGGNADHRRAAFGRLVAESVFWAPAALLPQNGVSWTAIDASTARATVTNRGLSQEVEVTVAEDGRPVRVVIPRWSNANAEKTYQTQPFGGYLSDFKFFSGYHLPTKVEAGNFIGSNDYFPFFRIKISALRFVGCPGIINDIETK